MLYYFLAQYYQDYHYDSIQKTYVSHQVTALDITNKYISIDDSITGVINRFLEEEGVMPEEATLKPKKRGTLKTQRNSFPQKEQDEIRNTLGSLCCKYRYQRDAMKAVFFKYNGKRC